MKSLLTILTVLIVLASGCKLMQPRPGPTKLGPVSAEDQRIATAVLAGDSRAITGDVTNKPPLTMYTRFASACPYCGTVNVNQTCGPSGGSTVTNGQIITIPVPLPGGGTSNFVYTATANGSLQTWSISFVCRNKLCGMMWSDYRYQMMPTTRSIRLPVFGNE